MHNLYNHITSSLSDLDLQMVKSVPSGGNWKDIPTHIPSKRLERIRETGGRTTYYGRLRWDYPSYTVTTYFNRPGNGCNIHPDDSNSNSPQHRLISFREAARLQSFPDKFRFFGTKTSMYKQIGNAVPPLLAYSIAKNFKGSTAVDLFCGCGGLSYGFEMAGFDVIAGLDIDKHSVETWKNNHQGHAICGDITNIEVKESLYGAVKDKLKGKQLDLIIGGPPCQGFSTAGWRLNDDPRNKLWNHYLEVVEKLKPKYFIIENVMGLLSATQKGNTIIDNMRESFGKIGYKINHKKMNAEEFGVPQLRRRIFIVGSLEECEEYNFPEGFVNNPVTVADAIKNLPSLGVKDGKDEVVIEEYETNSLYESWLLDNITTEVFLSSLKDRHSKELNFDLFSRLKVTA